MSDEENSDLNVEEESYNEYNESVAGSFNIDLCLDNVNTGTTHMDLYKLICNGNISKAKILTKKIIEEMNEDYSMDDDDDASFDGQSERLEEITFVDRTTPLLLSAKLAIPDLVKFYLGLRYSPNFVPDDQKLTPLLAACSSRPTTPGNQNHKARVAECLQLLLAARAKPTVTVTTANTGLHLLAANDYAELCGLLLDKIDINCLNEKECTAMMVAAARGHSDTVAYLKKAGADLALRNDAGLTALELAVLGGAGPDTLSLLGSESAPALYRAWRLVHREAVRAEHSSLEAAANLANLANSRKMLSNKYFSDPLSSMCAAINMSHLEPIFHASNTTLAQLRCFGDRELKSIGVSRYLDRKILLSIMQDVHKMAWSHEKSLLPPQYTSSLKSTEISDFVSNISEHLELMASTVKYLRMHLSVNTNHYRSQTKTQSNFFEKVSDQSQFVAVKTDSIHSCMGKIETIFHKIQETAFEDDTDVSLGDERETVQLNNLVQKRLSRLVSGPCLVVCCVTAIASLVTLRLLTSRLG